MLWSATFSKNTVANKKETHILYTAMLPPISRSAQTTYANSISIFYELTYLNSLHRTY